MKKSVGHIEYLKLLTRQMLAQLELAMREALPPDNAQLAARLPHEWIFGSKQSLAATLVMLAELMLKLEQAGKSEEDAPVAESAALTQSDVALVESFVKRMGER